jgi:hypothetical protein
MLLAVWATPVASQRSMLRRRSMARWHLLLQYTFWWRLVRVAPHPRQLMSRR